MQNQLLPQSSSGLMKNIGSTISTTAFVCLLSIFALAIVQESWAGLPAFPGAEGFGSSTTHGRGGKVLFVTNLKDEGPGSLREAAQATEGRRIVVFRVSGTIHLKSPLTVKYPYCMIAGQTAPGDGICLTGAPLRITTHDIVVRYLRSRPGDDPDDYHPEDRDGFTVTNSETPPYNIVLDHLSASWAIDENMSTWNRCHDITFQWCIISEGLVDSLHPKGPHSKGLLIGDHSHNISIHHNLFAHNGWRNPLLKADTKTDIVNNVIYNWGGGAVQLSNFEQTNLPIFTNIVANYFKTAIAGDEDFWEVNIKPDVPVESALYLRGNIAPHRPDDQGDEWSIVKPGYKQGYRTERPMNAEPITTNPALKAYSMVLEGAGAVLPKRDAVDSRIVRNVIDGSGTLIDKVSETPGFPLYNKQQPPVDSDHDGMSDSWEKLHNCTVGKDDSGGDSDQDGYTNIEEYINSIVANAPGVTTFPWNMFLLDSIQ